MKQNKPLHNHVYISIGTNLGDREKNLATAVQSLHEAGDVYQSAVYETAAWGIRQQPSFLNQVVLLKSPQNAQQIMQLIVQVEEKMGRQRKEKYGPRLIDLDILFFNNEIINTHDLMIPHPQIQNRRFVLEPLNEIAPTLFHPVLNKTIHELLITCPDPLGVKKIMAK